MNEDLLIHFSQVDPVPGPDNSPPAWAQACHPDATDHALQPLQDLAQKDAREDESGYRGLILQHPRARGFQSFGWWGSPVAELQASIPCSQALVEVLSVEALRCGALLVMYLQSGSLALPAL